MAVQLGTTCAFSDVVMGRWYFVSENTDTNWENCWR